MRSHRSSKPSWPSEIWMKLSAIIQTWASTRHPMLIFKSIKKILIRMMHGKILWAAQMSTSSNWWSMVSRRQWIFPTSIHLRSQPSCWTKCPQSPTTSSVWWSSRRTKRLTRGTWWTKLSFRCGSPKCLMSFSRFWSKLIRSPAPFCPSRKPKTN